MMIRSCLLFVAFALIQIEAGHCSCPPDSSIYGLRDLRGENLSFSLSRANTKAPWDVCIAVANCKWGPFESGESELSALGDYSKYNSRACKIDWGRDNYLYQCDEGFSKLNVGAIFGLSVADGFSAGRCKSNREPTRPVVLAIVGGRTYITMSIQSGDTPEHSFCIQLILRRDDFAPIFILTSDCLKNPELQQRLTDILAKVPIDQNSLWQVASFTQGGGIAARFVASGGRMQSDPTDGKSEIIWGFPKGAKQLAVWLTSILQAANKVDNLKISQDDLPLGQNSPTSTPLALTLQWLAAAVARIDEDKSASSIARSRSARDWLAANVLTRNQDLAKTMLRVETLQ